MPFVLSPPKTVS